MFKFLHLHAPAGQPKAKRSVRVDPEKRIEAERPARYYSLLLPPTFPRDRR